VKSAGLLASIAGLEGFEIPPEMVASAPPEVRGTGRDDVRLMVVRRGDGSIEHRRFVELGDVLVPGDLLVVNTSATLPAALPAVGPGDADLVLHVSGPAQAAQQWVIEVRVPAGAASTPLEAGRAEPGWDLVLPAGGKARLVKPLVDGGRLWTADLSFPGASLNDYLGAHGRPIRYPHVSVEWPLSAYQTVFATEAGSAEMPSAGRAFTTEMVTALIASGIDIAPIVLHAGVSSLEGDEAPFAERYRVPASTARRVNAARSQGGRVIAVGSTAVRALETVADGRGVVHAGQGWTDVVVTPERGVRAVDGLLTGWHEPRSSHIALVAAVSGVELLARSYMVALEHRYLWHEFGDLHLILPW